MAVVLLCSACGGSSSAPDQVAAEARVAGSGCAVMGGDQAVASSQVGQSCAGCSVVDEGNAADGDLQSHATLHTDAAVLQGVSLRVTRPDHVFPAGPFGAIVNERRASAATNPYFLLRTYLAGALQEEFVVGFSNGVNTLIGESGGRLVEAAATKSFDAVEVSVGSAAMAGDFSLDVIEMCGAVAGPESASSEHFFGPSDNGRPWTLQGPGRYTSAEMRDWFKALEAVSDTGEAIALPVSYFAGAVVGPVLAPTDQSINVVLERSKMLDETTFFQINTIDHTGPFVRVYEGHVVDRPGSLVQLTLADDFMRGVVRIDNDIFLVRIGTQGNLPAALVAGGDPDYAYTEPASGDPVGCPEDYIPGNHENVSVPGILNGGQRYIPPYLSPDFVLAAGQTPELVARIILDADLDAYKQWGRHLPAMMIAMNVEQNVTYRHQIGVRFRIAGIHLNTIEGYYPAPLDTPATFDYMEAWWGSYMADRRDIVHLLTGQPIGTYMASCIGGAGSPYGYFYTSTGIETNVPSFRTMNFMSHEIGHLFSAHHHYGNHVEAPGSATIMIQGYTPGDVPVFSSLSRGVMRGWAEQYLAPVTE